MKNPSVSLIIPLYNAEDYIADCIQYVQRQTYTNIEVIFVNDGSTDNTAFLCRKKMESLVNSRLISTNNQGVSAARNVGIDNATGDYLLFADVDDYILEDYVEYLVDLAVRHDADIAICDYRKQKASQKEIKKAPKKRYEKEYSSMEALENISYRKELSGSIYAKLIRRKIADFVRFNEKLSYYEDYIFVCDAIANCKKIVFGNSVEYLYLQHPKSSTHKYDCKKSIKSWKEIMFCISGYQEKYPELKGGFQSKALAVSMVMLKRIYKQGYDETLIRKYICENCLSVAKDKKCTNLKRLLAICSCMSIDLTMRFGKMASAVLSYIGVDL